MPTEAWIHRVHRAALFIEPRLFEPVRLADVVAAAGGSLSELHRVFTRVYGVSLAGYIRGRRLSEAADMLRRTRLGILDIAVRCQYGSQAAFTRAFRRHFGTTPGAYRRGQGTELVRLEPATASSLRHRARLDAEPELVWVHVDRRLSGLVATADLDDVETFQRQQRALAARVCGPAEAVGVTLAERPGGRLEFFLGVDADRAPADDDLEPGCLPRGLYAVFTHRGPPAQVRESIGFFSQAWSPSPAMRYADRPSAESFRLEEASADEITLRLWVPVEPVP